MAPELLTFFDVKCGQPGSNTGSSLIEVLVAVLIFVAIVVGLGNSVVSARRAEASSRQTAEATTLAIDKVEHLRALSLADSGVSPGSHADTQNPLGPDGTPGGIYTRAWTVTEGVPLAGMRRAQVTVSWRDHERTASVALYAYLSLQ